MTSTVPRVLANFRHVTVHVMPFDYDLPNLCPVVFSITGENVQFAFSHQSSTNRFVQYLAHESLVTTFQITHHAFSANAMLDNLTSNFS